MLDWSAAGLKADPSKCLWIGPLKYQHATSQTNHTRDWVPAIMDFCVWCPFNLDDRAILDGVPRRLFNASSDMDTCTQFRRFDFAFVASVRGSAGVNSNYAIAAMASGCNLVLRHMHWDLVCGFCDRNVWPRPVRLDLVAISATSIQQYIREGNLD